VALRHAPHQRRRGEDEAAWLSFRNVPAVHLITVGELNAYDVLVADYVVFTKASLPGVAVPAAEEA
jgi:large subunit ribosomal protein L4